jgi:hypothetical protein
MLISAFPPCIVKKDKKIIFKMFSLFGKTINLSGEEVSALGFEPVPEFLPPARFKSGNNVVQRHRMTQG